MKREWLGISWGLSIMGLSAGANCPLDSYLLRTPRLESRSSARCICSREFYMLMSVLQSSAWSVFPPATVKPDLLLLQSSPVARNREFASAQMECLYDWNRVQAPRIAAPTPTETRAARQPVILPPNRRVWHFATLRPDFRRKDFSNGSLLETGVDE